MKLIHVTSLLFVMLLAASSFADVTQEAVSQAIDIYNLEHPYLFFSKKDLPAIRDRIKNAFECSDIYNRLAAEANRFMYTPVEQFVAGDEEDFYAGRLSYLRDQRKAAETLAFVYQITGRQKYADKAFEFAEAICDVSDWVNGYHQFPVIYTRVWPWNVQDDQVNFSVDLEAAHTAFSLALVYDWLYNSLNKPKRDRIRGALLEKVITRVRGNYEYHWWAASYRCNWCSVCNSSTGCSALVLLKEDPNLIDVVAESYNRITRTLDEVGQDGGWQEGCSYWNYMLRTSMQFGDALKRVTNGRFNLFDHPAIRHNPISFALYNHIPPNISVNFGDSSNRRIGQTYFCNKLIEETGSSETAWYRNTMFGNGTSYFDILWPKYDVEPQLPRTLSRHFRSIDWAVMRNSIINPEDITIAVKAGYHNDPHHGHLDCGNFILYWRGEGFISEMGRGAYDERYFQESRWEFPQASAKGHNVVLVNGEGQIPAKHKDEPWQEGIGGRILTFRTNEQQDYTLLDASGAYPGNELKKWRRHIILDKPQIAVILDEVGAVSGSEIALRFHSEAKQVISDRYMTLDGEKGNMVLIPVVEHGFSFRVDKHSVMEARGLTLKNARFRQESFCDVVVAAQDETTVIASVILPTESSAESGNVVKSLEFGKNKSGVFSMSFNYRGEAYNYHFTRKPDGLYYEENN